MFAEQSPFAWGLYVTIVLHVGMAIVFILRAKKRRRRKFLALALRLGFSFDPVKRSGRPPWGEPFELFRRGSALDTKNHLTGHIRGRSGIQSMDLPAEVFDFAYRTELRQTKRETHYCLATVVAIELPEAFPSLVLRPDTPARKFLMHMGADAGTLDFESESGPDIEFESDEFNKRYHVASDDHTFAHAVITPEMIDFLLPGRDIALQIAGDRAIFFREKKLRPGQIRSLLEFAGDFYARIPNDVKKHYARTA